MTQQAMDSSPTPNSISFARSSSAAPASEAKHYAHSRVDGAQAAWLRFRATECQLEASTYKGGSIYPLIYANCEVQVTLTRINELLRVVTETPH